MIPLKSFALIVQSKSVVLEVKIMFTFGVVTGRSHDSDFCILVMFMS